MVNDKPTSQRMGFGYQQAKAAGVPYIAPRSIYAMNTEVRERHFAKALKATLLKFPEFSDLVEAAVRQGSTAEEIFTMIWPGWEDWDANYGD